MADMTIIVPIDKFATILEICSLLMCGICGTQVVISQVWRSSGHMCGAQVVISQFWRSSGHIIGVALKRS